RGLRVSSPNVAAASKPINERIPKTTPRPTPDNPVGDADGVKTISVLLLPAFTIAITPSSTKTSTSTISKVRSTWTDAFILRIAKPTTIARASRLKIHQGTSALNVEV